MSPADAFAGMPRLGRYVLVREIARSNDVVWEATDPQMSRRVAIKELTLPASLAGGARRDRIDRFYREARAAGAMSHPNIVTIHEVSETDGRYFIVMEYLEGRTLRDRLSGGALPLGETLAITTALCDALEYAHARGVIHRDIKPDNVHLLADGRVKLTDFGIARITHEDALTMNGQVFGTPSYMSPEQITGKPIDARTDIFSLGILLYEMLIGKKPFTGDSVVTITYHILNDDLPPVTGIPPALESVLRRATAKEPGDRFAGAGELRAALLDATSGRAGAAPASSPPSRTSRFPAPHGASGAASSQTTILASAAGAWPDTRLPSGAEGAAETERPPRRSVARILVPLLLLGLILLGGWTLSRAFRSYAQQARRNADGNLYQRGRALYDAQRYEQAAGAFERLRGKNVDPQIARQATLALAYCYLGIGGRFFADGDLMTAERWYRAASSLAPDNPHIRHELNRLLKVRGAPPGSSPVAPTSPAVAPPPPTPAVPATSAADFQNANAQRAEEAARLLERGNAAWSRGDREEALRLWAQAEQTGPGSPAAQRARAQINTYNAGGASFRGL